MGVRINISKTYKTQINYDVLLANGKKEAQAFEAEFKRLTRDEVKEMMDTCKTDSEMVRRVLVGWVMSDLETKEVVEFTETNLEFIMNEVAAWSATVILRFMETVGANRGKS